MAKKPRKPFDKAHGRDYKDEYRRYQGSEEQKANRAARGRARYKLEKEGKVSVGDGKDVNHKNSNPRDNSPGNLSVESKSKNRGRVDKKTGKHK